MTRGLELNPKNGFQREKEKHENHPLHPKTPERT
jgi:hypothetical protein